MAYDGCDMSHAFVGLAFAALLSLLPLRAHGQAEELPSAPPASPPVSAPAGAPAEESAASPPPAAAPASAPMAGPLDEVGTQDYAIGFGLEGARRLGAPADALGPRNGFGFVAEVTYTYLRVGPAELTIGIGFHHQRFRKVVSFTVLGGSGVPQETERSFTHYDWELQPRFAVSVGPVRPFLRLGAGFGLAYFSTREPEFSPGEKRAARLSLSATIGLDVITSRQGARLGLEATVASMIRPPEFAADSQRSLPVFGNRGSIGLIFRQPF